MRKIIFSLIWCFIMMFFIEELSVAQDNSLYKWSHQSPQGNTLRWIKRWDANNWYAVGYAGTFMKTSNAGNTWYMRTLVNGVSSSNSNILLYDADFVNMSTGFACGSSGRVARTTNGGLNWDTTTALSTSASFYSIFMLNATTGFISGTTSGRVSMTTDGGATWAFLGSVPSSTFYSVFAIDANTIYAGNSSGTFYKTTNAGGNWTTAATGTGIIYEMNFLDANTGYVVGSSNKVSITTNAGANWTSLTGSLTGTFYDVDFSSMASPPAFTEGFESVTFPPTGWMRINTLGAKQWSRSTTSPFVGVADAWSDWETLGGIDWLLTSQTPIFPGDSLVFWARRSYTGSSFSWDTLKVMVSTTTQDTSSMGAPILMAWVNVADTGASTFPPRLGAYKRYAVSLNSYAGQNVYVGFRHSNLDGVGIRVDELSIGLNRPPTQNSAYITGNSSYIYKAPLGSNSWDTLGFLDPNQFWTSTYYTTDLSASGDTLLTAGAFGLINSRFSVSNRVTYTDFIKAGSFYDIWADSGNGSGRVIAVGAPAIPGSVFDQVMYSTNGGNTWQLGNYSATDDQDLNSIDMLNSTTGFVAGDEGVVAKTVDGGANWTPTATNPSTTELNKVVFLDANTGYVFGASGQGHKTTDGGATWTALTTGMGTSTINGAGFVNANTGWVVGLSGKIFMTTDGGANFTQQTSNYSSTLNAMSMLNANTGYVVGLSGTVRKTTNGGANWDTANVPFSSSLYGVQFIDVNTGFVSGAGGSVYRTTDGGTTWEWDNTSGSTQYGVGLANPYTAFICGLNAFIYKYFDPPSGNGTFTNNIPDRYFLDQNYPNPFNPTTTIKFGLPKAGIVSLRIYDMAGREVANLFNNTEFNAGEVAYRFNGSSLASGVYFYTLIVDNNLIATKKMVLLK